jgi:hypothetical protein
VTAADSALTAEIRELRNEVGRLQDIQEIRNLHYTYGYYLDKWLFPEIVGLFAEDAELRFHDGIFRGKDGARRVYLSATGYNGPVDGLLSEHVICQDVIHVAPDRTRGWGRFRCLMQGGAHESVEDVPEWMPKQFWEGGIYENEYVREDGIWKFKVFDYRVTWQARHEDGWAHIGTDDILSSQPFRATYPEHPRGPDELRPLPGRFPANPIMSFHYPHPVTGKLIDEQRRRDA